MAKVTLQIPVTVQDLAIVDVSDYTPNDDLSEATCNVTVSSGNDIPYQSYQLKVTNGESIGIRATQGKAVSYSQIMELFTVKAPGLYDQATTAYIKNGGTVDTALQAVAQSLVSAGLIPDGSVS